MKKKDKRPYEAVIRRMPPGDVYEVTVAGQCAYVAKYDIGNALQELLRPAVVEDVDPCCTESR